MVTERIQREVDRLLDEAGAAMAQADWVKVREASSSALILDPKNSEAESLFAASERGIAAIPARPSLPPAFLLSPTRIVVMMVLSAGLYIFYWAYLTWKQLKTETSEDHYPIWHALSLGVPIYGLFRLHAHFSLVNDLASKFGGRSLSVGAALILVIVGNGLDWTWQIPMSVSTAVLILVASTCLHTAGVYLAQTSLNTVWRQRHRLAIDASISWVELAFVLFGLVVWAGTVLPE